MALDVQDLEFEKTYTIWQRGRKSLYITYLGDNKFSVINGAWRGTFLTNNEVRINATGTICSYDKITKGGSYAGLHHN